MQQFIFAQSPIVKTTFSSNSNYLTLKWAPGKMLILLIQENLKEKNIISKLSKNTNFLANSLFSIWKNPAFFGGNVVSKFCVHFVTSLVNFDVSTVSCVVIYHSSIFFKKSILKISMEYLVYFKQSLALCD